MKKYLLSTGRVTTKFEEYIVDLFRLYLQIYPDDIPGASNIGFNFILTDVMKSDLPDEVLYRAQSLVNSIKNKFSQGIDISLESCELIDEKLAKIVVKVNKKYSEEITIDLYKEDA
jgi:hypothetical protein